MTVGTPDWLVAEGGGTPDVTIVGGGLLTDSEHDVLDHTGIPGVLPPNTTSAAALVDNSGGTADGTIAALANVSVAAVTGASVSDVNARLATISDNFADLAAKVNQIIADLS